MKKLKSDFFSTERLNLKTWIKNSQPIPKNFMFVILKDLLRHKLYLRWLFLDFMYFLKTQNKSVNDKFHLLANAISRKKKTVLFAVLEDKVFFCISEMLLT